MNERASKEIMTSRLEDAISRRIISAWEQGEGLKSIMSSIVEPSEDQIKGYLTEIGESRKRARKTQTQINRLKKKTQAILDKLQ